MIKNKIIFFILLIFSKSSFADLSCSANGTQLYYINGVHVETKQENSDDADNITNLLKVRSSEIDKNSNLPDVQGVYNYSTGFFDDFTKLREQLVLDAIGPVTSDSRRKYFQELIKAEFGISTTTNYEGLSNAEKSELDLQFKNTMDYIYNPRDKNALTLYDDGNFNNNKLYKDLHKLHRGIADLLAIVVSDQQVVNEVKKKISDSLFSKNQKVIFVAHSQGNEALRTSYLELRNDLSAPERKSDLEKLDSVFGVLHVASPSPLLIFPLPSNKSQAIKLDVDLVIRGSTLFTTENEPVAINYFLETEGAHASIWRRIPLIGSITGTISDIFSALFTLDLDKFLHHSFKSTYLNPDIYARSLASDPSTSDTMPNIFNRNLIKIAEALGDNCLPTVNISAVLLQPKSDMKVSVNSSFTGAVNDSDITYLWTFSDGASSKLASTVHQFASYGEYTISLTATNKITKEVRTATQTILVEPDRSISVVPGSTIYNKLLLINDDPDGYTFGVFHKRSAQLKAEGPVGSAFEVAVVENQIHQLSCGGWVKETANSSGGTTETCRRSVSSPVSTTLFLKNILQCGGEGCETVDLAGFSIPYTEEQPTVVHFSAFEIPFPYDF